MRGLNTLQALMSLLGGYYASLRTSDNHTVQDSIDIFRSETLAIEKFIKMSFSNYTN